MKDFKYEQLKQNICDRIEDGTWTAGSRILSEREMAQKYDVSRITARKAVEELVSEGYLERIPGKRGTFVRDADFEESKSDLIGVAIDHSYGLYHESLLMGIEDCLWKDRKHTVFCNTYQDINRVEEYFHSLSGKPVDGLIFSPVITERYKEKNMSFIRTIEKARLPFVLVDRYIPDLECSYVVTDNFESSYKLTEALIERGHSNILLLAGLPCTSMLDRMAGFEKCLKDRGIEIPKENRLALNDLPAAGSAKGDDLSLMKKMLIERTDYTAIISLNTPLLKLADEALRETDRETDIEAGCFDAERDLFLRIKQVARIIQPTYRVGYEAAKTLLEQHSSQDKMVIRKIIPSELYVYGDI